MKSKKNGHLVGHIITVAIIGFAIYAIVMSVASVIMINDALRGVYSNEKYVGLLFADTTGVNTYRLDVYDPSGRQRSSISFSMDFTGIQFSGDLVYINSLQECMIYTADGTCKYDGRFERSVDFLIPSSRISQMTAVSGRTIEKIQLK